MAGKPSCGVQRDQISEKVVGTRGEYWRERIAAQEPQRIIGAAAL